MKAVAGMEEVISINTPVYSSVLLLFILKMLDLKSMISKYTERTLESFHLYISTFDYEVT